VNGNFRGGVHGILEAVKFNRVGLGAAIVLALALRAGLSQAQIRAVCGGNVLRLLESALP
jgi:microsomal dipeptidase-like Zn-dependent dipeptidase